MTTEYKKVKGLYSTTEAALPALMIAKQRGYSADTRRLAQMESDGATVRYFWDASRMADQTTSYGSALIGNPGITGITPDGGSSGSAATVQAMLKGMGAAIVAGATTYINNGTSQQASSNFNISGAGVIGTTLSVTGNLAVNTNKFTVTAASGNTLVAGTLAVTGTSAFSNTIALTNAQAFLNMVSSTSGNPSYISLSANSAAAVIAKEGVGGTDFITGGLAGALQILTQTSKAVQIGVNGAVCTTFAASGFVGIGAGATAPESILHLTQDSTCNIINSRASTDTPGPGILLRKARGTHASPTLVAAGDMTGKILAQGCHVATAGSYADMAYIGFYVGSTAFSSGQRPPSEIQFHTNPANGSQTMAMKITEDQKITVGAEINSAVSLRIYASTNGESIFLETNSGDIIMEPTGIQTLRAYAGGVEITGETSTSTLEVLGAALITGSTLMNGRLSVNTGTSYAHIGLYVGASALTGANQYGSFIDPTFSTAGTTVSSALYAHATTTTGATYAIVSGIEIDSTTKGGSETITTNYGLRVRSQTAGATNYAIHTAGGKILFTNDTIILTDSKTPASDTATGTAGMICWDASYIYICTGTNIWRRSAISGGW